MLKYQLRSKVGDGEAKINGKTSVVSEEIRYSIDLCCCVASSVYMAEGYRLDLGVISMSNGTERIMECQAKVSAIMGADCSNEASVEAFSMRTPSSPLSFARR